MVKKKRTIAILLAVLILHVDLPVTGSDKVK